MKKRCPRCKMLLNIDEFNWKIKDIKRASHCKKCSRKYIREHYYKNKKYYLKKARIRNSKLKEQAYEYICSYFKIHPCIDCGEKDILVLEFDHIDRSSKSADISYIIKNNNTLEKLKREIEKCEVRCANCHRRKTEIENNSWKVKMRP